MLLGVPTPVVIAAVSAFVCPAVYLVAKLNGRMVDPPLLVAGGAVISLLVIAGLVAIGRREIADHGRAAELA